MAARKLKRLKDSLRNLTKEKFRNISVRVVIAITKLKTAQADLFNDPINIILYDSVKSFEEPFFKEKSMIK